MTDNEIKKALECCTSDGCSCTQCPYEDTKHIINDEFEIMPNGKSYDTWSCDEWLKADLLDLINRQNAENSNLQEKNLNLTSDLTSLQKDLTSAKAEIERLQLEKDNLIRTYAECQAEAVKEFAERLKEKTKWLFSSVSINHEIDNTLKEMGVEDK